MSEKTIVFNEKEQLNTDGAKADASNTESDARDIAANWWKYFSGYRTKKWKKELKSLSENTGISLSDVNEYIGGEAVDVPGFYKKMPKKRETYIGIGLAFGTSIDVINKWLKKYGMKRGLYVKDVLNDLVWIYLINQRRNSTGDKNYYNSYAECLNAIEETYYRIWNDDGANYIPTDEVEEDMRYISEDEDYKQLTDFVERNIKAFSSAYAKPRKMLNKYVEMILDAKNAEKADHRKLTLNGLRGYLDDSMINYISGGHENINTIDRSKNLTSGVKQIPKSRKSHISLCLALGMTSEAIDEYLESMGYTPLDAIDKNEGMLINILKKWENVHPLQRLLKENTLTRGRDRAQAADEMLMLRRDLKILFDEQNLGRPFPYLND